jgi:hypothetical protein
MGVLVIEGEYRILGAAPNGDSVRFYPNDPSDWDRVGGPHAVRPNSRGGAQLRLDGVDALETHFSAERLLLHQPLEFGHLAARSLLDWLGFRGVARDDGETVTSATPEAAPGYIFTRNADVYGRCVAFAGRGAPPARSGTRPFFGAAELRRTANYRLVDRGLAYPTYYRRLFPDLRETLTKAATRAREAGRGFWPQDRTQDGARIRDLASLTDDVVILPKLFRRLAAYLALSAPDTSLDRLRSYLERREDRLFILSTGHWTGFDTVVSVKGQTVRLTQPPEDLVFEER